MKVTIDTCGESLDVVFDRLARMKTKLFFDGYVASQMQTAIFELERVEEQFKRRIETARYLGDTLSVEMSVLNEHRVRLSALKAELEDLKVIYEAPEPDEEV
ncbi:hypothetical protein AA471_23410 [Salmonella enterica subsp. enterica]|nr:hypothetical protein [Salmonella enterica subsp. enterica]ECI0980224.1 hypothetical protein [Salmonella enterica subsp. enterica serovar Newport]ECO1010792.1 hypothetical protein [Salmonella enterica subsp. enterica serovar Newport]EDQ2990904.1 hypothetical protein [Salmonella enterica subsp. enterica]